MHPEQLILRCYAKRSNNGSWYAMCIDLNIDAEGGSLSDVKSSLEDAIIGYLETVTEASRNASLETLLNRPASLTHHVLYAFGVGANKIRNVVNSSLAAFQEPIPIRLALPS